MKQTVWRPNVLILGGVQTFGVVLIAYWMISQMKVPVSGELLGTLIGMGVGPLIAITALMATDSPPPMVDAATHVRIVLGESSVPASPPVVHWWDKLKPNVLILTGVFVIMTVWFGILLFQKMQGQAVVTQILSTLMSIGLSGMLTIIGKVATDPPPPTVPADVHKEIVLATRR